MRRLVLAAALVTCAFPVLARENYALLVGASQYPALDQKHRPRGPANDMALVATCLTTEVTPDKSLPMGTPGRVLQGVFAYTLMPVQAEYQNATYGQIGQEVLRNTSPLRLPAPRYSRVIWIRWPFPVCRAGGWINRRRWFLNKGSQFPQAACMVWPAAM